MALLGFRRCLLLYIVYLQLIITSTQEYSIRDVAIQALRPKGIRVSMPAQSKQTLFAFHGNVNQKINENDVGRISAELIYPVNGRWLYEDLDVSLKVGDIIYYYVTVVNNGKGYVLDNQSFTVKVLESPDKNVMGGCLPTITSVRNGEQACAGQIIFEDNFDSLREDLWQIEQYIPDEPDFPFVSYQRPPKAEVMTAMGGYLYITPKLLQNLPGYTNSSVYTGTLDLFSGCTAISSKCRADAWGASILPPIVSGRLTSKTFSFKYGVVEIRAKLPKGDWLYPDILLEPLMKKYGTLNYASGVLRIAGARGNAQLVSGGNEVGNKLLYGGPILNLECRKTLLGSKLSNVDWGNDYHVYTARWEPERITLSVDGVEWARIEPAASGLQGRFARACELPRSLLATGTSMAPFDDYFFISLAVSAGGITEFDDNVVSDGRPKPWRNRERKATLRLWQDLDSWYPTWTPDLVIDYVRVRAL